MADAAPNRLLTSVATTGVRSTARPARKMGDSRRQVSWLTAQTSLPPSQHRKRVSGIQGSRLAVHSCGGSRGFDAFASTAFPFHSPSEGLGENQRTLISCSDLTVVNSSLPPDRPGAQW